MPAYRKIIKDNVRILHKGLNLITDRLLLAAFTLQGKKPFSRGYDIFKRGIIQNELASPRFSVEKLPKRFGHLVDERIIEYPWFFSRLPKDAPGRLLDAGSVCNFDYIVKNPSLKNKQVYITTLAPELQAYWEQGVSYVYNDLRSTCYASNYFDWIVSLSTIEHVGMDNTAYYTADLSKKEAKEQDYLQVVAEMHRILKPGGTCYISIPFGAWKTHEWLQVFDATMVDAIIKKFSPKHCETHFFRYYPKKGWEVATAEQCGDACYHDYHVDGTSADKPAAAEAVVCIELRK